MSSLEARLTASVELSGVLLEERNPLFWTFHTKIQAGITNSRTREHLTALVGSVKNKNRGTAEQRITLSKDAQS